MAASSQETIAVVGAGQAAGQLISSLRSAGFEGRIRLFGEEPSLPYQRPPLSKEYLAGEMSAEQLAILQPEFYENAAVELSLGTRIEAIDREAKRLLITGGESVAYDKLALTTGARVRRLGAPGEARDGIHVLRTIADVDAIRAGFAPGRRLAIVGGGYIGLEVAAVAVKLGLVVTVLELADRVMNRVVCPEVSAFYQQEHESQGVRILTGTAVSAFEEGEGGAIRVLCGDAPPLEADIVVVGVGILPEVSLAEAAGLDVQNGILVDAFARTSDPDIVAAGDCTNHINQLLEGRVRLESVQNANAQARVAAATLCGQEAPYAELPWFWSQQYDLKLQIVGLSQGYDQTVIRGAPEERAFAAYYMKQGVLIAADAVNSPRDFMMARKLIAAKARIDPARLADTSVPLRALA